MLKRWKADKERYRPLLTPGKKPAEEVLRYLGEKYSLIPEDSAQAAEAAAGNIREALRHTGDAKPGPCAFRLAIFRVEDAGNGAVLYCAQREEYRELIVKWRELHEDAEDIPADSFPLPILVNAELNSGYVYVEGSPGLSDEIELFQGHTEKELENAYIVSRYAALLKRAGRL